MSMKRTAKRAIAYGLGGLAAACLLGLVVTGWKIGWGPFGGLYDWDGEVRAIAEKYPAAEHPHEIVFYGASNFRLWTEMENDLSAYKVQNHGFGGSTDRLLAEYADVLLYPYAPDIVVFQTGSNDYAQLRGTDEEKLSACMAYKAEMFALFHERLPEAHFIVLSGIIMPGRSEYTPLVIQVNAALRALCDNTDYLHFVDAAGMTYDGSSYAEALFESDGIHLTREAQQLWCSRYIQPAIEELIENHGMEHLRRED